MCNSTDSGTAKPRVLIDNARTRVTEWRFAQRGDNTGWHRHEYDYIVVPIQDGFLKITDKNGDATLSELKAGVPYYRDLGVEHDVQSDNDFEFAFIEVEFLEAPKR